MHQSSVDSHCNSAYFVSFIGTVICQKHKFVENFKQDCWKYHLLEKVIIGHDNCIFHYSTKRKCRSPESPRSPTHKTRIRGWGVGGGILISWYLLGQTKENHSITQTRQPVSTPRSKHGISQIQSRSANHLPVIFITQLKLFYLQILTLS